jgi:hypothetical protein
MPSLADLLNKIGEENNSAVIVLSDIIDGISSILGPVSGAIGFIDMLLNSGQPSLSAVQQAIQNVGAQLGKENEAKEILDRNTTLNGYIADAYTNLETLNAEIAANPNAALVVTYVGTCVDALNKLAGITQPDIVWNSTAAWPTYWSDAKQFYTQCRFDDPDPITIDVSYGPQNPPLNPDGLTVFYYIYGLPLYLFAVSIFITVGGSLDPNFVEHYSDALNRAVAVLTSRCQQILGGITPLAPPNWSNGVPCGFPGLIVDLPGTVPRNAYIHYGAVEKFSGYSSVGGYYQISVDDNNQAMPGTYPKWSLRQLKRAKDVHIGVGLPSVFKALNSLNRLLGNPEVKDSVGDWWSMREVVSISQLRSTDRGKSLRALAAFIIETEPLDTPYSSASGTVSIRTLLTSF